MVKVTDPENKKPSNDPGDTPDDRLGLPEPVMVYKEPREDGPANVMTWEKLDESGYRHVSRNRRSFACR